MSGLFSPAGPPGRWAVPVSCWERPLGRGWAWPGVPALPDELRPARGLGQRASRGSGVAAPFPYRLSLLSLPFFPPAQPWGCSGRWRHWPVTVLAGTEQRCLRGSAMVRCIKEPHNPRVPCRLAGQPSAALYRPGNTCLKYCYVFRSYCF